MFFRWKQLLIWGPCLAALFALGWWRGQNPDFDWRVYVQSPETLVILTPDPSWIPNDILSRLTEGTRTELRIEKIEDFADFEAKLVVVDAPDLIWIPLSWARGLSSRGLLFSLGEDLVSEKVHADFRTATKDYSYMPVAWAPDDGELRIEGLAVPLNAKHRQAALDLVLRWTSPDLASRQIRAIPAASTLAFSSNADLPFEKKVDSLRNSSLLR